MKHRRLGGGFWGGLPSTDNLDAQQGPRRGTRGQPEAAYDKEELQRTGVPEQRFVFGVEERRAVLCTTSDEHAIVSAC